MKYLIQCCFIGLLSFSAQKATAQNMANGKKIYETRCLVCHQADGGGVPNMNAPLDGASNVVGNDIARLVKIIRNGYNERVALDGYYYSNAMTANPDLKDADIADVLSYIRNSWTNKASKITLAQVQKVKKK
ncbi:MAG: c-type cytochrome [Sediminibacterium sp.]|jgi:mono/diheme cytochrome c family protein|nr:cytochrome c [Sediminibacterium sp.]